MDHPLSPVFAISLPTIYIPDVRRGMAQLARGALGTWLNLLVGESKAPNALTEGEESEVVDEEPIPTSASDCCAIALSDFSTDTVQSRNGTSTRTASPVSAKSPIDDHPWPQEVVGASEDASTMSLRSFSFSMKSRECEISLVDVLPANAGEIGTPEATEADNESREVPVTPIHSSATAVDNDSTTVESPSDDTASAGITAFSKALESSDDSTHSEPTNDSAASEALKAILLENNYVIKAIFQDTLFQTLKHQVKESLGELLVAKVLALLTSEAEVGSGAAVAVSQVERYRNLAEDVIADILRDIFVDIYILNNRRQTPRSRPGMAGQPMRSLEDGIKDIVRMSQE